MLRRHQHGLQENIILDDELGKHLHVTRKIIMGVGHGRDPDICEKGLSMVWRHQHRQVLTLKVDANQTL